MENHKHDNPQYRPIQNRTDHNCFGCGPKNEYGLKMMFQTNGEEVFSELVVPDHLCGWDNLVHGGVISTILDEIMSWSAISLLRRIILTKSISVRFLRPVLIGNPLKVIGRVAKVTSERQAHMKGYIYDKDDVLLASSKGIFSLFTIEDMKQRKLVDPDAVKTFEKMFDSWT